MYCRVKIRNRHGGGRREEEEQEDGVGKGLMTMTMTMMMMVGEGKERHGKVFFHHFPLPLVMLYVKSMITKETSSQLTDVMSLSP